jgi:hypothetical protein
LDWKILKKYSCITCFEINKIQIVKNSDFIPWFQNQEAHEERKIRKESLCSNLRFLKLRQEELLVVFCNETGPDTLVF